GAGAVRSSARRVPVGDHGHAEYGVRRTLRRSREDHLAWRRVHGELGAVPASRAGHEGALMRRTRAGMTLMELVIGLVITGMMAIAGTAAFTSIIDHRRVITEATVETERAAALREMLRTWIGSGSLLATT